MSGTATATFTLEIARPREEVFAYLTDIGRHAEWSPKAYRVEGLDEPVHQGTTFTSYGWVPREPDHRNEVEVTEFEPASRFTIVSKDEGGTAVNRYVLTSSDDGTHLRRTMELPKPDGAAGALFPVIMAAVVKPGIAKGMKMFKANLEQGER